MDFSQQDTKIAIAKKTAQSLLEERGELIDSVFIGGSVAAGLGNPSSDIDLFVIYKQQSDFLDQQQQVIDGVRLDIEQYSADDFLERVHSLDHVSETWSGITSLWNLENNIDLASRFYTGIDIKVGERLEHLAKDNQDNLNLMRRAEMLMAALLVNMHFEDFRGAAAARDKDTAALEGQTLVACAGKAVTAACGDLYYGRKWLYSQIERSLPQGFSVEELKYYQFGNWSVEPEFNDKSNDLLRYAQGLISRSLIAGWDSPIDEVPILCDLKIEHKCWARNTMISSFRFNDRIILHQELGKTQQVNLPVALVWALCDGRDTESIQRNAQVICDSLNWNTEFSIERVETILMSLQKMDLIENLGQN